MKHFKFLSITTIALVYSINSWAQTVPVRTNIPTDTAEVKFLSEAEKSSMRDLPPSEVVKLLREKKFDESTKPEGEKAALLEETATTATTTATTEPSAGNTADTSKDSARQEKSLEGPKSAKTSSTVMASAASGGATAQIPTLNSLSVSVQPFTGSASVPIAIDVPAGRAGIQPNVALVYSSGLPESFTGVGWNLDMGSIQRSTKKGPPKYNSTDTFVLMQNGSSGNLVYDTAAAMYRLETEGAFAKITSSGSGSSQTWIMIDKKGTKYFFGQAAASRQSDPADAARIFEWALDRVEDVSGNYMTISYMKHGNELYPDTILYTGNSNTPAIAPYAKVVFSYTDVARTLTSYKAAFLVSSSKLLRNITVYANNIMVRDYWFTFSQSVSSKRYLLKSVKQFGADFTSSLPEVTFTYQGDVKGFVTETNWPIPSEVGFIDYLPTSVRWADLGVRVADMNGDAYPDLMRSSQDANPTQPMTYFTIFQNDKSKIFNRVAGGMWYPSASMHAFVRVTSWVDHAMGVQLTDVNGDLRTDMVRSYKKDPVNGGTVYSQTFLNAQIGPNATETTAWAPPAETAVIHQKGVGSGTEYSEYQGVIYADVNGDGFMDIVQSAYNVTPRKYGVYLNQAVNGGTGWVLDATWTATISEEAYTSFSNGATLADLNGDGLPEIVYINGTDAKVFMNTGKGWTTGPTPWDVPPMTTVHFPTGDSQFGDINGDGLADIVRGDYWLDVMINTGAGWFDDHAAWQAPSGYFAKMDQRLLDANADGVLDYMYHLAGFIPEVHVNISKPADLLVKIDNGIGGTTEITYASSAQYNNTFLPFIVQVVKSVQVSTGTESYTTNYSYANGLWGADTREFRGFGQVRVTDPDGNYTVTNYLQDKIYKGQVSSVETYDAANALFAKTINTWDKKTLITGDVSVFPYLKRVDSYLYDGAAPDRRTAQEFFYDETTQYGNLTKTIEYGEVSFFGGSDSGSDKRTTESLYVNNSSLWILGLPKQVIIKDNGGTQVRLTSFYYDNNPNLTDLPTKGRLTKRVRWNGTGNPTPTDLYSYDTTGNLLTTTDPLNNVTTITYDPLKLFPLTTTNALSHVVTTEYYGVNGVALNDGAGLVGLWGQVKSVKDANNQKAYRVYDTFGRMTKSISPLDSVTYPTTEMSYAYGATYLSVTAKARKTSGQAATIDSVQYFDGLGRLIQTKSKTASAGQFIVSGQTQYTSRGLPQYKYIPRFTSNALTVIDPVITSEPRVTLTYDAMGRLTRTTNPDGTYSNTIYYGWETGTRDERGARTNYIYDAYGRVVTVVEYSGYDGRSPTLYPASTYTVYATTNYTYDSEGNLKTVVDNAGNTTIINYDFLGRKTSMTDPDMGTWVYTYDSNGNLKTQRDAKLQTITFSYDALNRLKTKVSGTALNVTYTYDDTVNSGYAKGRLSNVSYVGGSTKFVYDVLGRETQSVKTIDGTSYTVSRVYDNLNNVMKLTYPDLSEVHYQYNSVGQLQAVSNSASVLPPLVMNNDEPRSMFALLKGIFTPQSLRAEQSEAKQSDECASRHCEERFADGSRQATKQSQFANRLLRAKTALAMTKAKIGKFYTSFFEPNFLGVKEAEAAAPNTLFVSAITYNAMGQPLTVSYGNGAVTTNTYNSPMFRLSRIYTVKGTTVLQDLTYTYDAIGNIRTITDAKNSATQTFSYDHRNRLLTASNPAGYGSQSYSYDTIGNIASKEGISYTYSKVNAGPHAVTSLSSGTTLTYDLNGNMSTMVKTGDSKALTYDVENRLIDVKKNGTTVAQYFYDGDGGRTAKINYASGQAGNNTCFLAGTKVLMDDGRWTNIEDIKVGDRVASYDEKKMAKTSAKVIEMFDDETAKEYLLINGHLKVTPNHKFYSKGEWKEIGTLKIGDLLLDENGNEVSIDKIEKITSQNPVQVYNLEVESDHNYYADGLLVHNKLSYNSPAVSGVPVSSGVITRYLGSLAEETKGVVVNHVFMGSAKIATVSNNEVRYSFQDHLGSANVVTNSAGSMIELIEYKPFGEFSRRAQYGTSNAAWYYFTGKPLDDETGLMFYGARYYSPLLGRFITPDTIVQSPMNPQTLNRYSYCNNNPVNYVDSTGHSWKKFWKAAVTAIVGTVLIIASGGTLAPVIGTYWAGVATGAMVGATIGGTFAAATGGNIGMGILTGAVGGGLFAGLAPALSGLSDGLFRGVTMGGAAGPFTPGVSMASNFTSAFLGGAASGAAVAGISGADVGQGALIGGAFAGGFSVIRDSALWMRAKMVQQSRIDPRNASGKSVGFNNDGFKLGGGRYDPTHPNGNPSPLGGHQGRHGQVFGMPYQPGSVFDRIVEGYAGPHDFLNSWGYNQFGNLQNQVGFERVLGATLNPLNVVIATPIAVPSAFPRVTYPGPGIVYGIQKPSKGDN